MTARLSRDVRPQKGNRMTIDTQQRETWEEEVFAGHRWGPHGDRANKEHSRIRELWDLIQPVSDDTRRIIDQIVSLEICNWRLEDSIVAICEAIGRGAPSEMPIGHGKSMTPERWRDFWSYYLTLRKWLNREHGDAYFALLTQCDTNGEAEKRIREMLGERTELKELYVERFCLCLERWLSHALAWDSPLMKGHLAAVEAIEEEIGTREPDRGILGAMRMDGDGRLIPCSHKAFRRYDIIVSSIGCGTWRGKMPERGIDGLARADLLASYLDPIEDWIGKETEATPGTEADPQIVASLGDPDDVKIFLASLLTSLLRADELSARRRAEKRKGKPNN